MGPALSQPLVNQAHRHRAFADRGGHALDRAGMHVSDGEHAAQARLQKERMMAVVGGALGGIDVAASERSSPVRRSRMVTASRPVSPHSSSTSLDLINWTRGER